MPVLPPAPPALQEPAPVSTSQNAEAELLDAYDSGEDFPKSPRLHGAAALSYQWLRTALTFDPAGPLPRNPFATGPKRQEIQALLALLKQSQGATETTLKSLAMKEAGTAIALWRWGQEQVQKGTFKAGQRRAWENRLISAGPALSRGYALRHALCFALAEGDEARFVELRAMVDASAEDMIKGFQRLFGMLGGPLPSLRLWTLPGLDYQDLTLTSATRLWFYPMQEGPLPTLPQGTQWIIPSAVGEQEDRDATLAESTRKEGEALAAHLQSEGMHAWFAPSRAAMEQLGLVWFPVLLEVDAKGNLTSIHMGDAGPRRP